MLRVHQNLTARSYITEYKDEVWNIFFRPTLIKDVEEMTKPVWNYTGLFTIIICLYEIVPIKPWLNSIAECAMHLPRQMT